MKINITILTVIGMLLTGVGCDMKDPIYNTSHPDHGTIVLTIDWADHLEGVEIPGPYRVQVGDYQQEVNDMTFTLDHLLGEGTHRLYIYNEPEQFTVNGTMARVKQLSGRTRESEGSFIHPMPGWFFSCTTDISVEKDQIHATTASMHQQVRELTLLVEPEGTDPEQILAVDGWLTGIAGELDMENNQHGKASHVALDFVRITEGTHAGKLSVTVRLLGITGAEQKLHVKLYLAGSGSQGIEIESDLSSALSEFNNHKKIPFELTARLVIVPDPGAEPGFTATIEGWKTGEGGSGVAT